MWKADGGVVGNMLRCSMDCVIEECVLNDGYIYCKISFINTPGIIAGSSTEVYNLI